MEPCLHGGRYVHKRGRQSCGIKDKQMCRYTCFCFVFFNWENQVCKIVKMQVPIKGALFSCKALMPTLQKHFIYTRRLPLYSVKVNFWALLFFWVPYKITLMICKTKKCVWWCLTCLKLAMKEKNPNGIYYLQKRQDLKEMQKRLWS